MTLNELKRMIDFTAVKVFGKEQYMCTATLSISAIAFTKKADCGTEERLKSSIIKELKSTINQHASS